MSCYLAAAIQMTSGVHKAANLETASRLVELAARRGATLVVLPELFNCLGDLPEVSAQAEPIPGPTSEWLSQLAAEYKLTLVGGSMAEKSNQADKAYNTSLVFGPDGVMLSRYRKIHLFEIDLPGEVSVRETDIMLAGDEAIVTSTSAGLLGHATCYDLRFPELFRRLVDAGAEVFVIPSAFTLATGRDHWEVLLRARAIENQVFVVAPNQYGLHGPNLRSFGRSMIIDPWGVVLASTSDGVGVVTAEIDLDQVAGIRRRLPALRNRRRDWQIP